jgi:hypothetical protein
MIDVAHTSTYDLPFAMRVYNHVVIVLPEVILMFIILCRPKPRPVPEQYVNIRRRACTPSSQRCMNLNWSIAAQRPWRSPLFALVEPCGNNGIVAFPLPYRKLSSCRGISAVLPVATLPIRFKGRFLGGSHKERKASSAH